LEIGLGIVMKGSVVAVSALIGCQWGDEGKGKIVDVLSADVDVVARYQGGANAGHTVVIGDDTHVFHLLPVGVLRPSVVCLLGNGMVVDLDAFRSELDSVRQSGINAEGRLFLSPRAHVITPYHKAVDGLRETKGRRKIGTTLRGIGPAYETKAARIGIRVSNLFRPDRLLVDVAALEEWALAAGCTAEDLPNLESMVEKLLGHATAIRPYVRDARKVAMDALNRGGELLIEGAQGALLDIDHGTYPYVTSSNTTAGGAAVGLGLAPQLLDRVIGVTKAYTTRVGEGPFPTEFDEETAQPFRERAGEFGATTGRPRRCGWLDAKLLRDAVRLSGVTALVVTKLDILDGMENLRIATQYTDIGEDFGGDWMGNLEDCRPVYEDLPGWTESTAGATSWDELPENAQRYLKRIEDITKVPIAMVSTGFRRDQIVRLREDLLPARTSVA
jgi:adenylosuccinate synthase